MKHPTLVRFAAIAALSLVAPVMDAAPSLPISKGLVLPTYLTSGPLFDFTTQFDRYARRGLWFQTPTGYTVRSFEFHDEPIVTTGAGESAIFGQVSQYYRDVSGTKMMSFDLRVTVVNNTFSNTTRPISSGNDQGEYRNTTGFIQTTLRDAILTLEFVSPANTAGLFVASRQDCLAFYNGGPRPAGFIVPGWNLGTLAPGARQTLLINIKLNGAQGVPIGSALAIAINDHRNSGRDILSNRAYSLKISRYPGYFNRDSATPDSASVFHNL
jgi:hypothetical protein